MKFRGRHHRHRLNIFAFNQRIDTVVVVLDLEFSRNLAGALDVVVCDGDQSRIGDEVANVFPRAAFP